jgi:hypothetical protein
MLSVQSLYITILLPLCWSYLTLSDVHLNFSAVAVLFPGKSQHHFCILIWKQSVDHFVQFQRQYTIFVSVNFQRLYIAFIWSYIQYVYNCKWCDLVYVWYHNEYIKIIITHCDFIEIIECSFWKSRWITVIIIYSSWYQTNN